MEIIETYDNLEDWVRECVAMPGTWFSPHSGANRGSFMPISWADTIKHATEGWPEGMEFMTQALDRISSAVTFTPEPERRLDVAGAYPVIPLAVAGEPEHMVDFMPNDAAQHPVLTIRVYLGMSSCWSTTQIQNYGGAVLAWVDRLEAHGFSVQLDGYVSGASNGDKCGAIFGIKTAGQSFDLSRLAFALVHPGVVRRLYFRWCENRKRLENNFAGGYGVPVTLPCDAEVIHITGRQDLRHRGRCDTPEGAVRLFQEQLRDACEAAGVAVNIDEMIAEESE